MLRPVKNVFVKKCANYYAKIVLTKMLEIRHSEHDPDQLNGRAMDR